MFKSGELGDELQALKSEMSRLLNMPADDMFEAARNRSEALADQIKATLSELGETLSKGRGPGRAADRGAADGGAGIRLRARRCDRLYVEEELT